MYLVFDIGGSSIKYGYISDDGTIVSSGQLGNNLIYDKNSFLDLLVSVYRENMMVKGIALSCPGVIDASVGIIKEISAYPYIKGINIVEELSLLCDNINVSVENDAKCAALAEAWQGAGVKYNDLVTIVFGTGIGGAIIKDNMVHNGFHLSAGEVSTIIVDYDQETNKLITWADLASTKTLCQNVANAMGLSLKTVNGEFIYKQYKSNNMIVRKILHKFYYDIAIQLYNIQYLYDPGVICIGGGISKEPLFIKGVRDAVNEINKVTSQLVIPNIVTCRFYNEANLIGALYNHKKIFNNNLPS